MEQLQLFETPPTRHSDSVVYCAMRGGLVKIGMSRRVHNRMRQLGCDLVGVVPGGRDTEERMHQRFAHLRVRDEWFMPDISILETFRATGT